MESRNLPQSPLERCHMRWSNLFFGIIKCLFDKDPALCQGIFKALEREGLRLAKIDEQVVAVNPSDEILERSANFLQHGTIPRLRRGRGKKAPYPLNILRHYSFLMYFLKDLPKETRNPNYKRKMLRERIEQCSKIISCYQTISDRKFDELWMFPKTPKQMAREIIGELYGKKPESIDKLLDKARKEFPNFEENGTFPP
jgi:hypothetical protein